MFIPSETVAFLPTKTDPDACAVCVKGQPHKGTHREDLPHAMCDAAYQRLKQIVAGETPKARIPLKRTKTGCIIGACKTCRQPLKLPPKGRAPTWCAACIAVRRTQQARKNMARSRRRREAREARAGV